MYFLVCISMHAVAMFLWLEDILINRCVSSVSTSVGTILHRPSCIDGCMKQESLLTLSLPIPLKLCTLPYWSNPPVFFNFWHTECQKLKKWWVRPVWRWTLWTSDVFSDFAAPLHDLSCGPRPDPKFLARDTGQILQKFLAQNCAFWSSLTLIHD